MIRPVAPPAPRPHLVRAFDWYFRRLFQRHFTAVHLRTEAPWDREADPHPTLFVANHTNWWDGFYCFLIGRRLTRRVHVVMEKANLDRYRVFREIGTLQMRRDSLVGAYEDLASAKLTMHPGTGLWIYPQGQRRPATERPTGLERGAGELLLGHDRPVRLAAVALRYTYVGEQLPEAFALVDEPLLVEPGALGGRREAAATIEARLHQALDRLDHLLTSEALGRFDLLVPGRLSINKRLDRFRHRLGLLPGEFDARNG